MRQRNGRAARHPGELFTFGGALRFVAVVRGVCRLTAARRWQAGRGQVRGYPLPTKDGRKLRTIGDARAYFLALSKKRQRRTHWTRVRQLLTKEAGVAAVTQQVLLALSKDDELDVFEFEHVTSARRWPDAHKLDEED
jgi:hypothetical protein